MAGSFLYAKSINVNKSISVCIPTVGEVLGSEDDFFGVISFFIATPYSMIAQLDEIGVDFTEIDDWQLFGLFFPILREMNCDLVLKGIDLKKLVLKKNEETNDFYFEDPESGVVLDKLAHYMIAKTIRKILFIEKETKRPGNDEAKEYMIYKAKKALKRKRRKAKNGEESSQLDDTIIALVNREEFPYDYESVRGISIYQLYASLYQIAHKVNYDNLMTGCYAGTIDAKSIDKKELSWLRIND